VFAVRGDNGRVLARPLLARAVQLAWGWEELPPLVYSPRGKPGFAGLPRRCFSLSHSGGLALCALSSAPVGVDVERVRPHRPGLPDYALSPAERAAFDGSWEDFARLWTLKESWCKREDAPLFPPRRVETPPPCPHRSYAGDDWRAAVCCHDTPPADLTWLRI
jgi:phosphopantetheinyl transferase